MNFENGLKGRFIIVLLTVSFFAHAQLPNKNFIQAKIDFLEPVINKTWVGRLDFVSDKYAIGVVGGLGGRISEFDNKQFDSYNDIINYRLGIEYQYYLSKKMIQRGFYLGADVEFASRTVESRKTNEFVSNIAAFTPGLWLGYVWKPFKKANLIFDLAILHPRYTFGKISSVAFQTVGTPYQPKNLFNFLGPWGIGWRI